MHELITNLHIHTTYSDGTENHAVIADAALKTDIDVLIFTDHNVLVKDLERYYHSPKKDLLIIIGEEIHNPEKKPQGDHLIVLGNDRELSQYAENPQKLIDIVNKENGICFIAHPFEDALPQFGEEAIPWTNWEVSGYTGIEIWNNLSELKSVMNNYLDGLFYSYFPQFMPCRPPQETIAKWDELLNKGNKVVAIGGSDAHALNFRLGFIKRQIFPYEFHFQAVNTHILVKQKPTGDVNKDKAAVLKALKNGNAFVGYDLPASTKGFRFTAQGRNQVAWMGDGLKLGDGATIQIRIPEKTECKLIWNGNPIKTWNDKMICTQFINKPGVYRVECSIDYLGKKRAWIYSNPIYVT